MSVTLLAFALLVSSLVTAAVLIFPLRSPGAFLARLRFSRLTSGPRVGGLAEVGIMAAAVFLLVAGVGAAVSHVAGPPQLTEPADARPLALSQPEPDGEMLSHLERYTQSLAIKDPAPMASDGNLLPDVNTMIGRLAARLETTPQDLQGWQMLGWSYFHLQRYEEAASAYAKAAALDPSSAELKRAYEEAKAKVSGSDRLQTVSPMPAAGNGEEGIESGAQIRAMVDGLANRLEASPRDAEGWMRLIRSRVVLGEKEAAATALAKALDVFKDDSMSSSAVMAVAIELGLTAN